MRKLVDKAEEKARGLLKISLLLSHLYLGQQVVETYWRFFKKAISLIGVVSSLGLFVRHR